MTIYTCKDNVRYCSGCKEFKEFEGEPPFICSECGTILAVKLVVGDQQSINNGGVGSKC